MRQAVQELIERYQNNLYAIAFNICKNPSDAQDVVQDTFIQYYTSKKEFEDEQHLRAWLIRVAINKAKNLTLTFWRQHKVPLDDYMETLSFETPSSFNSCNFLNCSIPSILSSFNFRIINYTRIHIPSYGITSLKIKRRLDFTPSAYFKFIM